ncbi:polyamine-transporting ATPase [Rhodococcus triatomae BKS 15-14]|nr:polyamine-transporting ATPase [Rhodococcus triatomae BKS 15-14]
MYAGLGAGLVTVYKGSGVVNFAQAAMALWGAFVFHELTATGRFILPVLVIPDSIDLGGPQSVPVALVLGVGSSALLGVLAHVLVFRPLREASIVARITAAVGLLTLLSALIVRRFGDGGRRPDEILPSDTLHFAGISVPQDRLWLLVVAVLLVAAVAAFFRYTLTGLAARANVDGAVSLTLSGWSVDRVAALTWGVGSALPCLLICLAAPMTGLDPTNVILLVAPGLAAMLVGRMSSVVVAAAAGIALGVLESLITYWQLQSWWPEFIPAGLTESLPFLVVVTMLMVSGRGLPGRGALNTDRLPAVLRRALRLWWILVGVLVGVLLTMLFGPETRNGLVISMIFAIVALSFVVLVGLVGQVSLGQAGVAGIAAFTLVRLTDGLPFPLSIILAAGVATVAGVIVGLPALRIRGAQLAIITLVGAIAVEKLILQHVQAEPGRAAVSGPHLGPLDLSMQSGSDYARPAFLIAVLLVLTACVWLVSRVIAGRSGRRLLAVRSNERAAASIGIDVARAKLWAFALSAFLAGLGGALLAYSRGTVSASGFGFFQGLNYLLYAFLGGITSVGGALVGGFFAPHGFGYVLINRVIDMGSVYDIIGGIALVLASIFQPKGAIGAMRDQIDWVRGRIGRPRRADAPVVLPTDTELPMREVGDRPALEVTELSVHYGGVRAVEKVNLTVRPGTIHGLIGPNGAGKTSLLDAITGFTPYDGSVWVDGRPVDDLPAHRRHHEGVSRTWQAGDIFTDLTVLDNVLVAAEPGRWGDLYRDVVGKSASDVRRVAAALNLLGIADLADRSASEISTGQLKLVGVARALASSTAVLLADEPAAGLDTDESRILGERLRAIADTGVAVVLIEHDLPLVMSICDEITVLDFGRVIAHGTPQEISADPAVLAAYVGSSPSDDGKSADRTTATFAG